MNNNQDKIKMKGIVKEINAGGAIMVLLENNATVMCRVSGKMRQNNINILPGDVVDVEFSLYDLTKGRIVYRHFG